MQPTLKPWHAHLAPWLLMLGPAAVIIAGGYTGWLAFSNQDAMVVDDYYRQGKAINVDLRRDRVASELGLSFNGYYDASGGKLCGKLLSFGAPIAGSVKMHLVHATQPEKDRHFKAEPDQSGQFCIALAMLERARWQILLENERRDWRLNGNWKWPQQKMVDIKADGNS